MEDDVALRANLDRDAGDDARRSASTLVKVAVYWNPIAPNRELPHHAEALQRPQTRPPTRPPNWAFYDARRAEAKMVGLKVGFMLTSPAPLWATGVRHPRGRHKYACGHWKPSPADFGAFVAGASASATRQLQADAAQSSPLPRVSWWSIWNEPNYGPNLAPQAIDNNTVDTGADDVPRSCSSHAWGR